ERTARDDAREVMVGEGIDEYWVAEYASAYGDDEVGRERLRAYAHLLQRLAPAVGTAVLPVDETPSAIGLGVLERGWAGVYAMGTRREVPRRGAATAVVHTLACWAHRHSAAPIYLQVEAPTHRPRQLHPPP